MLVNLDDFFLSQVSKAPFLLEYEYEKPSATDRVCVCVFQLHIFMFNAASIWPSTDCHVLCTCSPPRAGVDNTHQTTWNSFGSYHPVKPLGSPSKICEWWAAFMCDRDPKTQVLVQSLVLLEQLQGIPQACWGGSCISVLLPLCSI
jgi:hypothetical protein